MYSTIIFDLSEVLIAGLVGVEHLISVKTGIHQDKISENLYSATIFELFRGEITETFFLNHLIQSNNWDNLSVAELQLIIRNNFCKRIPGTIRILQRLRKNYELILLSDHAKEWVEFIKKEHPFLKTFDHHFFSFEIGHLKQEPITFSIVLEKITKKPSECIFIDDMASNIAIANSVDIHGIHFENHRQLAKNLVALGVILDV